MVMDNVCRKFHEVFHVVFEICKQIEIQTCSLQYCAPFLGVK